MSQAIVGCSSPEEVDDNARLAREFQMIVEEKMRGFEERTRRRARDFDYFKKDR